MKINSFVQWFIKFFLFCVEIFYTVVDLTFVEPHKKYVLQH